MEASQALQSAGSAFPAADAGFSAYYHVPKGDGVFALDKDTVDQWLLSTPGESSPRAGVATMSAIGDNYSIAASPIRNIGSMTTGVGLYYDSAGWVVAYFPKGSASSQAWQAKGVDHENAVLTDVSATTLLDAINDVLAAAPGAAPLTPTQVGYHHWQHPSATGFLMFATALGSPGADGMVFAVPEGFTVLEASMSVWVLTSGETCVKASLDGVDLTGERCTQGFQHLVADPAPLSGAGIHDVMLEQLKSSAGASGLLGMLVYASGTEAPKITFGDDGQRVPKAVFAAADAVAPVDTPAVPLSRAFAGGGRAAFRGGAGAGGDYLSGSAARVGASAGTSQQPGRVRHGGGAGPLPGGRWQFQLPLELRAGGRVD